MSPAFIERSKVTPPDTLAELMDNAIALSGRTLADIAKTCQLPMPHDLKKHKGWCGELIEIALGADAHHRPLPDFTQLDVELKTIPVNLSGTPQESTFVCVASLNPEQIAWHHSLVYKKLKTVLWVPILSDRSIPLAARIIGRPFLWQPNEDEMNLLKNDYEHLMSYIIEGNSAGLSAKIGQYLQIRPKARNSLKHTKTLDAWGDDFKMNPRGFYLRASFTKKIIARVFNL